MSDIDRVTQLLRAHFGRGWERLKGSDFAAELEELNRSVSGQYSVPPATTPKPEPPSALSPEELDAQARKILDVDKDATFREIRQAYDKLKRRCDKSTFEAGSPEEVVAKQLRARVQWAYSYLSKDVDDVTKRFGSLELD